MIDHIIEKEVFQEVLREGVTSRSEHFTLYRMNASQDIDRLSGGAPLQVGVVVPKRLAKKAVTRNAIKRQVYNIAYAAALKYPHELHVIRLNKEFDRKIFLSPSSKKFKLEVNKELRALYSEWN